MKDLPTGITAAAAIRAMQGPEDTIISAFCRYRASVGAPVNLASHTLQDSVTYKHFKAGYMEGLALALLNPIIVDINEDEDLLA